MSAQGQDRNAEFLSQRSKLLGVAYRMLGSMSDAEDVVQDCYLRWQESPLSIDSPAAYLRKIAVNLCLDRLRARRNSKVEYVGPWVPEPYYARVENEESDNPEYLVSGLSTAFLMVLERLTPLQRAVYLLKQVVGLRHDEIAELLEITVEASRTNHRRAKLALSTDAESRFSVDPAEHHSMLERFMIAVSSGDVSALQDLLAANVTCYTDGGGKAAAASRPFSGASAVIKFVLGLTRIRTLVAAPEIVAVNGSFGIFITDDSGHSLVTIGCRDAKLSEIFIQRNPDKLAGLLESLSGAAAH